MGRQLGMRTRGDRQRGASLVEFAVLMPLLVVLLLGIVEFGWGLAQQLDVRHMAREALRMAVVDDPASDVETRVCDGDIVESGDVVSILRGGDATTGTSADVGNEASVTITANLEQITGLFGWAWGASPQITSTVFGRNEQPITDWTDGEELAPCP